MVAYYYFCIQIACHIVTWHHHFALKHIFYRFKVVIHQYACLALVVHGIVAAVLDVFVNCFYSVIFVHLVDSLSRQRHC